MYTTLSLIRHGHTDGNGRPGARLSGRTDVPLSHRGREEVRCLQSRLAGSQAFAAIYSSPLSRAHDTASSLAEAGLGPVQLCRGLQEIDCGSLEGMPLSEVRLRYPELWEANLRQTDEDFRWPGGESYREFRSRCLRTVRALVRSHPGARVSLVTHAGLVSQVLGYLAGLSPACWGPFQPGNAGITVLRWSHGTARVLTFDDRAHLPPD